MLFMGCAPIFYVLPLSVGRARTKTQSTDSRAHPDQTAPDATTHDRNVEVVAAPLAGKLVSRDEAGVDLQNRPCEHQEANRVAQMQDDEHLHDALPPSNSA